MRYLTGWTEPGALLLMRIRNGNIEQESFFCPQPSAERERWEGVRPGPAHARSNFGFDNAKPFTSFNAIISSGLADETNVLLDPASCPQAAREALRYWQDQASSKRANGGFTLTEITPHLAQMRMNKSAAEIAHTRRAAGMTANAVRRVLRNLKNYTTETQIAASISHRYAALGVSHAFQPIVASGANACILHYSENNDRLDSGKLVLVDTGCEADGYTADVSRTYPVNGKYTEEQRKLYDIVLAAQEAAIDHIRPSSNLHDAQQAARQVLASGLRSLGILPQGRSKKEDLAEYYMHGIGHFVGLEVHDAGIYSDDRGRPRKLRPGMCLTVEPGLYLDGRRSIPAPLRNTGIRIEDTVLVRSRGCEVLTARAPKAPDEIEELFAAP